MSTDMWLAASLFALVSLITPGPNNTLVLASGVNFGLYRTVPHLLGICLGFALMQLLVGLGLHRVLAQYPIVLEVLRYAGAAYMVWLAWKLATATTGMAAEAGAPIRPWGFWKAAAFQWLNPKAWVMCVTAMTAYLPVGASLAQVALLPLLFMVIGLPAVGSWAAFGSAMRGFLQDPFKRRVFNISMALALLASLYPLLTE